MSRHRFPLPAALVMAVLILVALAVAQFLVALQSNPATSRIYTVAQILAATSRNPREWDGKVVRVRGMIQPGLVLLGGDSRLLNAAPAAPAPNYVPLADNLATSTVLWVTGHRDDGLTAWLRRLPVAGGVLPSPRPAEMNTLTTYRVQLHSDSARCPSPSCVVGTLLDYATTAIDPVGEFPGSSSRAAQ